MSDDYKTPTRSVTARVTENVARMSSVARAVPVLIANDVRRTVQNAEIGTAKAVGRAALDVREMSNPVSRTISDGIATMAPIKSMKASTGLLMGASAPQVERAAGRAVKAVGTAAYSAADGFFKGVDGVEKALGKAAYNAVDGAAKGVGRVEHAAAEAVKGAASRVASAFASKPQAPPQAGGDFVAKNEQQNKMNLGRAPQQTSAAPGKDGTEKTSGSGSKGTYQTLDGRAVDGTPAQQAAWSARRKTA